MAEEHEADEVLGYLYLEGWDPAHVPTLEEATAGIADKREGVVETSSPQRSFIYTAICPQASRLKWVVPGFCHSDRLYKRPLEVVLAA
jgi:hypothetical protein